MWVLLSGLEAVMCDKVQPWFLRPETSPIELDLQFDLHGHPSVLLFPFVELTAKSPEISSRRASSKSQLKLSSKSYSALSLTMWLFKPLETLS
jgi:hypothetical protein